MFSLVALQVKSRFGLGRGVGRRVGGVLFLEPMVDALLEVFFGSEGAITQGGVIKQELCGLMDMCGWLILAQATCIMLDGFVVLFGQRRMERSQEILVGGQRVAVVWARCLCVLLLLAKAAEQADRDPQRKEKEDNGEDLCQCKAQQPFLGFFDPNAQKVDGSAKECRTVAVV